MFGLSLRVVACVVTLLPLQSLAASDSSIDYTIAGQLHYKEAARPIAIQDKVASFRVGGAALQLTAAYPRYGSLYLLGGGGYSPKERASFLGAAVSGSADSYFYGAGYEYQLPLNDRHSLVAATDYIEYRVQGDFTGSRLSLPVAAKISSKISTADFSLGWRYLFSEAITVTLGAGRSSWQIDATARGRLGASVSAQTEAVADGWDRFGFVGGDYRGFKWPISWRYQRGVLSADNRVTLNAFQLALRLPL